MRGQGGEVARALPGAVVIADGEKSMGGNEAVGRVSLAAVGQASSDVAEGCGGGYRRGWAGVSLPTD